VIGWDDIFSIISIVMASVTVSKSNSVFYGRIFNYQHFKLLNSSAFVVQMKYKKFLAVEKSCHIMV